MLHEHQKRDQFSRCLVEVAEFCLNGVKKDKERKQLLMDIMVLIGDLTASDSFTESSIFVNNDGFNLLYKVLESPHLRTVKSPKESKKEPHDPLMQDPAAEKVKDEKEITHLQFQEIILWTIANAVADESACQQVFLERHEMLTESLFGLVQNATDKTMSELCFLIDNMLHCDNIKKLLFDSTIERKTPSKAQQPAMINASRMSYSSYKESEADQLSPQSSKSKNSSKRYKK